MDTTPLAEGRDLTPVMQADIERMTAQLEELEPN